MAKKNEKKDKQKVTKKMMELFFMSRRSVNTSEIKSVIVDSGGKVQFWEEMNVLEIECTDEGTVDFELYSFEFKESSDKEFIEQHQVKSVYLVNLEEKNYREVKPLFREISERLEGFFCTDSEDFQPIYESKDLY